jgi:hypothetical protein
MRAIDAASRCVITHARHPVDSVDAEEPVTPNIARIPFDTAAITATPRQP